MSTMNVFAFDLPFAGVVAAGYAGSESAGAHPEYATNDPCVPSISLRWALEIGDEGRSRLVQRWFKNDNASVTGEKRRSA